MFLDLFRNLRAEAAEANVNRIVALWKEQVCRQVDAEVKLVEAHRTHVAAIEALNLQLQFEAMRELTEVKKAHAAELNRVIEENQRLRDDVKRLQFLAIPALKNIEIEPDKTAPPSPPEDIYRGTPWQRILAREMAAQDRAAAERRTRPVPKEGATDGSSSEGRDEAPLGEQGKPS